MTCRAGAQPQPRYRVTFRDGAGVTVSIVVRAEDSGSAQFLALAKLARARDWAHAEWTWAGTERA